MFILRLELGLGVDYLDHELPMAHYYSQEGCAYISCWHCMDFLYGWCVPFTLFYFLSNFSYFFPFRFLPDLTLISLFFANCVSFPWFRVFFSESLFFVFYFSFIRACLIVSFIWLVIFLHAPIGTLAKAEWLLGCHSNASFRPAAYA